MMLADPANLTRWERRALDARFPRPYLTDDTHHVPGCSMPWAECRCFRLHVDPEPYTADELAELLPSMDEPHAPDLDVQTYRFTTVTTQDVTLSKGLTVVRPVRLICSATSPNHPQPNPNNPNRKVLR